MGIEKIIHSYQEAIKLIPIMEKNYISTFTETTNKSDYFLDETNDFISKLGSVYREFKDKNFPNINPRISEIVDDNTLRSEFINVLLFYIEFFFI
jgi:hypothetical protein